MSLIDTGLCPGNYFDYEDDETAIAEAGIKREAFFCAHSFFDLCK